MSSKISVVIPHYQETPGILKKAVESAFLQTISDQISIIVVDDESPVHAADELREVLEQYPDRVTIIRCTNGGAGAARNIALDNIENNVDFVAFLDSDDEWYPDHLENALSALEEGYDFYFSDYVACAHRDETNFKRIGTVVSKDHRLLDEKREIYAFQHTALDHIVKHGNVIGTSNVVYSFSRFSKLRFREEFYNGQDFFFWMDIEQLGASFVFSFKLECDCGSGFNIYSGAGWGTGRSLQRLRNELKIWKNVNKIYQLDAAQRQANDTKILKIQQTIVRDITYRIIRRKSIEPAILRDIVVLEPMFLLNAPRFVLKILREKVTKA